MSRRVRPETVNYARRAKRVDVRKLKENIWKGLDIIVPPSQGLEDEVDDIPTVLNVLFRALLILIGSARKRRTVVRQQTQKNLESSLRLSPAYRMNIQRTS